MKTLTLTLLTLVVLLSTAGCGTSTTHLPPDPITPEQTDTFLNPGGDEVVAVDRSRACQAPMQRGPCRARITRFYFNAEAGTCAPFRWGGCSPGANNFATLEGCQASCE